MVVLHGCSQGSNFPGAYIEAKAKFEPRFTDHLPKVLPRVSSFNVFENRTISHSGIWVKGKFDEHFVDSILQKMEARAIAKYAVEDTCLLLIDKHLDSKNWLKMDKDSRAPAVVKGYSPCTTGKLPLPKFWSEGWGEGTRNPINLESGYRLYVIKAKSGVFWDADKLPNGRYTPEGWEHGYSKGVAINPETSMVIFWFDIW